MILKILSLPKNYSKLMLNKKLIIGTANFCQKYGIGKSKVDMNKISRILRYAKTQNLEHFDTAIAYNNSQILFKKLNLNSKINLKIIPINSWKNLKFCRKIFEEIKVYKNIKIVSIMLHDSKFFYSSNSRRIFNNLLVLKKEKYFKKIGVSIYNFQDLNYIIKNFKIDIIQCPFNILDRRLIKNNWLKILRSKKIEVHVRSIFFQGLLIDNKFTKNKYFKQWKKIFQRWFEDIKERKLSPTDLCLSYVLNYKIDKLVIGINDKSHLESLINFKRVKKLENFGYIETNNTNLYDTRKWSHLWTK